VLDKLSYKVHTVLNDNGSLFKPHAYQFLSVGATSTEFAEYGLEHYLTNSTYPWTNGQVKRINRTIAEATIQRFQLQTTDELNEHLQAFLLAYNHAKRLKTLRGPTHRQELRRLSPSVQRLGQLLAVAGSPNGKLLIWGMTLAIRPWDNV
jgi:hypothetical protein